MSFLAGRLAGKEAAYFFQETKHAVNRLAEKSTTNTTKTPTTAKNLSPSSPLPSEPIAQADILPEVLRHSLPSYIYGKQSDSSSLSTASKWALQSDPSKGSANVSSDALNPLRAYVSLPQVTFGPKRWKLPSQENSVLASTANELRKDTYTPVNPEKLKAAAEVGKAFAVATAIVFGGVCAVFSYVVSKLELQDGNDIRTKGQDFVQPKFETIREQLVPLKIWAEEVSKKWHIDREQEIKEKPILKELSKVLGGKTSN